MPRDLSRSFKVCSDAKESVGWGKQRQTTVAHQSLVKLQPWFLSFAVEDQPSAELRLQWMSCPWAEHSDDEDDDYAILDLIHDRNNSWFDALQKYNHTSWQGWNGVRTMSSSIGLNFKRTLSRAKWVGNDYLTFFVPGTAKYWQIESCDSAGGSGTAINGSANSGMTSQRSFHVILSSYWGEHNSSS